MVGHAGSPMCIVHAYLTAYYPRSRSRSRGFWNSENCTFLHLSPLPFWRGAQIWWLIITIVWDLVYSFSEPDLLISPAVGGHVTSRFLKCWYHQNTLGFISTLPEARSLWLWMQVGHIKLCKLAGMNVSPLPRLFLNFLVRHLSPDFKLCTIAILHEFQRAIFLYWFRLESIGWACS